MLRVLTLSLLLTTPLLLASVHPVPAQTQDDTTVAQQQNQSPRAAPKRDCERNQEGVS
jgi:hypothetical protein